MALIKCSECGKDVSDKADACPHCGCPANATDVPRCPNCNSTHIVADKKGFGLGKAAAGALLLGPVGLLGGMIGSKNTILVCSNCGNRWKPYVYPPDY